MSVARNLSEENYSHQSSEIEMNKINNCHDYEGTSEERKGTEHPYDVLNQDRPETTNSCRLLRGTQTKALIVLLITTNIIAITALIVSISCVPQSSGKVDGGWSEWSAWSKCDVTCGNGKQTRIRTCTNPTPYEGGRNCEESWVEIKLCQFVSCINNSKGNGSWSVWSTWTACDVTCGKGSQARFRMCSNPAPEGNGQQCVGNWFDLTTCRLSSCSVDGAWSGWSTWSKCGVTCGNGTQTRIRTCTNPTPLDGGRNCTEDWNEMKVCQQTPCPSNKQGTGTMVAFTAYGNTVVNSSFVFPSIIINYGNGYNNSTGQFICEVAGIYFFAVHVGKTLYSFATSITCSLYINSDIQLSAAEVPYPNDINNRNGLALSLSGTFYLKQNDTVSVGCSGVNLGDRSCSFTGFLVTSGT